MELEILKKNYNKVIDRYKKAEAFFNIATDAEVNKWMPEFQKIIIELSNMMKKYAHLTGKEMTSEEVMEGFK